MHVVGVHRTGGLGNQLFQYCAARAVADANHGCCKILIGPETNNTHNTHRHDYAKIFMTDAEEVSEDVLKKMPLFEHGHFCSRWDPSNIMLPCQLRGYFQYLPALEKVLPVIRQEWLHALHTFRQQVKQEFKLEEEHSVCMHVRRGDYLRLPHFHFIQPLQYYEEAFQKIVDTKTQNVQMVYIVSDDPEWCAKQPWSFPFHISRCNDEMLDLALLSLCKAGTIMANSTFSWWGAMLAGSRTIIYPSDWINLETKDLFPPNWIKL